MILIISFLPCPQCSFRIPKIGIFLTSAVHILKKCCASLKEGISTIGFWPCCPDSMLSILINIYFFVWHLSYQEYFFSKHSRQYILLAFSFPPIRTTDIFRSFQALSPCEHYSLCTYPVNTHFLTEYLVRNRSTLPGPHSMFVIVRQDSFISLLHLMREVGPRGRTTCLVLIGIRLGGCIFTRHLLHLCLISWLIRKSPHFRLFNDKLYNILFHLTKLYDLSILFKCCTVYCPVSN